MKLTENTYNLIVDLIIKHYTEEIEFVAANQRFLQAKELELEKENILKELETIGFC